MRIVISGDWHLDTVTAGYSRFEDLKSAVTELGTYIIENRADYFVFLGDLANPDSGSMVIRAISVALMFAKSLADMGVKSVWITGNHDVVDDPHGRSTLTPLNVVTRVCEGEPSLLHVSPEIDFLLLPYPTRVKRYDPDVCVRKLLEGRAKKKLFSFGHLAIAGAQMGSESRDMARGSELAYPVRALQEHGVTAMFNGHYHHRQEASGVVMPGTLERLRFDEEGNQPGWIVLDA